MVRSGCVVFGGVDGCSTGSTDEVSEASVAACEAVADTGSTSPSTKGDARGVPFLVSS